MMLTEVTRTRTRRTRPVPKIATRPEPTRGYTRTRSLPVGLPLLGIIGSGLPLGPDHYTAFN